MKATATIIGVTQPILNHPHVKTPEDLIVYCARASNPKNQEDMPDPVRLLRFLLREGHYSPFDMIDVIMEVNTTRDVSRQMIRHHSFRFQEFSQRYADIPGYKTVLPYGQGPKEREVAETGLPHEVYDECIDAFIEWTTECDALTTRLKGLGVAREWVRKFYPEGFTVTRLYAKASLRDWLFYCKVRTERHTQLDHREVAEACKWRLEALFPHTTEAFFHDE